jgi:hypothetical protein
MISQEILSYIDYSFDVSIFSNIRSSEATIF